MRRSVGLVALLAGCGLVQPYPDVEAEVGTALCADGLDQDLDGKVDCEDEDCAGSCEEQETTACSNGWDEDGDGLVDHQDPGCWPHARVVVEDCVSTFDPAGELDVADPGAWIGTGRQLEYTEPGGELVRAMLGQSGQHLLSGEASGGAVRGARLEVEARLQPAARLQLFLLPGEDDVTRGLDRTHHPEALVVTLGLNDATPDEAGTWIEPPWVSVDAGGGQAYFARFASERWPASEWGRLRVALGDGVEVWLGDEQDRLRFASGGAELTPALPEGWSEAQSLRFGWRVPTAAEARVRAVVWDRPAFHPCGHAVPQLDGRVVAAAELASGRLCIVEWSGPTFEARTYLTEDGRALDRVGGFVVPGSDALGGALTWSAAEGLLVGVALLGRSSQVGQVALLRSADCATWQIDELPVDAALLPLLDVDGVAYEVDEVGVHALHLPIWPAETLVLRSPGGAADGFEVSPDETYRRPSRGAEVGLQVVGLALLGSERLALTFADDGVRLRRALGGDRWQALGWVAEPAGQTGRFDDARVSWGALVIRPPSAVGQALQGWLLTRGDPSSPVAGPTSTAVSRMRWLAR